MKPFAEQISHPDLGNFAKISPFLYRGAEPACLDRGYKALKNDFGIKTVISFRSWAKEKNQVIAHGMTPISIELMADLRGSEPPTEDQIRYFFYILKDSATHPVFIHCLHGKDRTGTMAAIYRMEVDGWTNDEAYDEMQHFGLHDNWLDLINFIKQYKPRGYWKS